MMSKILLFSLFLMPQAFAQNASEEAIILNQELKFLEESAEDVTLIGSSANNNSTPVLERGQTLRTQSLEQQFFGNESEDVVSGRAAAPRRRSN